MNEISSAPIWRELAGQPEAIEQLSIAVKHKADGVHHAWLMTGPPGSGRSNLARAFAAALLCDQNGCGNCKSCVMVLGGTHPDVTVLATEKVTITIDEVRALVATSQLGSAMGKYRIMIIEDADRMAERSSNVLLKALEEPPAGTLWLLCAPSESDMLPTIRSRVRRVGLKVPSVDEVANLLVDRDGIEPKLARQAAAEAQSHIGMARRLATSIDARSRRRDTLTSAMNITNVGNAVNTAERWLEIARKDAEAITNERDEDEKTELRRVMGIEAGGTIPPSMRMDFKNLEEAQKRRSTRSIRDGIDRILVDLLSLYRDVLTVQLATGSEPVNAELLPQIKELAANSTPDETIAKIEAISVARVRIDSNVRDLSALEALAVQLRNKPKVA